MCSENMLYSLFRHFMATLLLVVAGLAMAAESRVALVIGNASYMQGPLKNPVNDARAMAGRLKSLGFEVILKENVRIKDVGAVYREFRSRIKPGGVALFFYAGHGIQFKGQNYLPAVDSAFDGEEDVPLQSINLNLLLDNMDEAKSALNIVLLDACRDNPFARKFRGGARGLAQVDKPSGTLIHYATRPGSVAADGAGANGTYTAALLEQIDSPGVPVELMLKRVTNRVVATTRGQQEPWIEGSLRGDFYFRTGAPSFEAAPVSATDELVWSDTRKIGTIAAYEGFMARYPSSRFVEAARQELQRLNSVLAPVTSKGVVGDKTYQFSDDSGHEWLVCSLGAGRNRLCALSERPWSEVPDTLSKLSAGGWRIPSVSDMKQLSEFIRQNPDVSKALGTSKYWSADAMERIRERMWGFSFADNSSYPVDKSQPHPLIFIRNTH